MSKPIHLNKWRMAYRFVIGTAILVPSYPILALALSAFGVFTIFGTMILLLEVLMLLAMAPRYEEIKGAFGLLLFPFLMPIYWWYRYVRYSEIVNLDD